MNDRALQVLLVEDNAGDARLLREMFSKEDPDSYCLTHLLRMHEAESHLAKGQVDILLLDMGLPDGHGIETVRRAHKAAPDVPMIVLTGLNDEALAAEAMKEGAQDYLIKGQIENRALPRALRYAIERHRMQKESESSQTQQIKLKNDFLSHVSHELRSPLTSIYSFSTIIADGLAGATTQQQDEYLQIILRNVVQLKAMIEDLLEVTREATGKLTVELQRVSMSEAITDAANTLQGKAAGKNITLSLDFSSEPCFVLADPTRLRQILTILLDNAVKYTPHSGAIHVETGSHVDDPTLLVVTVSDSGYGIPPELTERIFEHLYQVDGSSREGREGLGLGLHIAKDLVTRMGGSIWVQSKLTKGSRFFFTIPCFSLGRSLALMLLRENSSFEGIVLLTAEIRSKDPSQEVPSAILSMVRILLQTCIRPDTDVLLPTQDASSLRRRFFVLACTQEHGAAVIRDRILRHFNRHDLLQPSDFIFTIAADVLPVVTRGANESMEGFVNHVSAEIQRHINEVTAREGM